MIRNERGITLIEILAAVIILGITVAIFTNISQYLTNNSVKDDERTEALNIANLKLNSVVNALPSSSPFANINTQNASTTIDGYPVTVNETALTSMTGSSFSNIPAVERHVSLSSVVLMYNSGTGQNEPRLITVTVSWGD
jgi:type II secretory pathway pseudopilin PulG